MYEAKYENGFTCETIPRKLLMAGSSEMMMGMTIEIHIRRSLLDRNPVRHLVWPKRAALNTTVRVTPCVMRNGFIGEGDAPYFVDEKKSISFKWNTSFWKWMLISSQDRAV